MAMTPKMPTNTGIVPPSKPRLTGERIKNRMGEMKAKMGARKAAVQERVAAKKAVIKAKFPKAPI